VLPLTSCNTAPFPEHVGGGLEGFAQPLAGGRHPDPPPGRSTLSPPLFEFDHDGAGGSPGCEEGIVIGTAADAAAAGVADSLSWEGTGSDNRRSDSLSKNDEHVGKPHFGAEYLGNLKNTRIMI